MTGEAIILDGVEFVPQPGDCERAYVDDVLIGELALVERDDPLRSEWKARKVDADLGMGDWRPMRSQAEARAFIVSKVRQ